jgi:hypothetical protein
MLRRISGQATAQDKIDLFLFAQVAHTGTALGLQHCKAFFF